MKWRWQNAIVALLIERQRMTRAELHRALNPDGNARDEASLDLELGALVRRGDLMRPLWGQYEIAPRPEPEQDTTMGRRAKTSDTPPDCYTIREFCERHRIGLSTYYRLRDQGDGPDEIRPLGGKVLITKEAAARWRAAQDAAAKQARAG